MKTKGPTLSTFFATDRHTAKQVKAAQTTPAFAKMKDQLAKSENGMSGKMAGMMIDRISDLLQVDIADILTNAWCTVQELVKYSDPQSNPKDNPAFVHLSEHKITSIHHPQFKPTWNGKSLATIRFDVYIELDLKGVILTISNGRIVEATIGSCLGSGSIGYSGLSLFEKQSKNIPFPTKISFGKGIPLSTRSENEKDHSIETEKTEMV